MRLIIQRSKTEEALVKGCKKNDTTSQQVLFDKYGPRMLGLCRRYINDAAIAEDVMICAFTKVFAKITQFKGVGSFEGWIRRIMINESLIYLRKNRNMYVEVDIEQARQAIHYDILESRLAAEELLKIIQELPEGYRIVFNLYAIEGYTHKEISEELGININTSKSQLSRARKWLQSRLMEIEQTEKILHYEQASGR